MTLRGLEKHANRYLTLLSRSKITTKEGGGQEFLHEASGCNVSEAPIWSLISRADCVLVNLIAFVKRLIIICWRRPGSSSSHSDSDTSSSNEGSITNALSTFQCRNSLLNILRIFRATTRGFVGERLNCSIPPFIFETVRISSTILLWCMLHCSITSAALSISSTSDRSRVIAVWLESFSRSLALAIELISSAHCTELLSGFRISCDVMSIKFSWWRFASNASCVRCNSTSADHFCCVMSVKQATIDSRLPSSLVSGYAETVIALTEYPSTAWKWSASSALWNWRVDYQKST